MNKDGTLTKKEIARILENAERAPKYGEPLSVTLARWAEQNKEER